MSALFTVRRVACLFLLVGCGGAAPAPSTPPAVPAAFSAMSQAQRLEHMKTVIRPRMAQVFQEHDAAKYADFGCRTCHGPNDDDPHAVLPVLTLSNGGYKKLLDEKTAMMLFMREKVTPTMVAAMGEPPFDMATRKGFGCSGCHRVQ